MGKVRREGKRRREIKKGKSPKKEDPGARKGRKVAKHYVFPMICGSGGSKSTLPKAAGAEPCGQVRDEKLHGVVTRSTFPSQNVQNTSAPAARNFSADWVHIDPSHVDCFFLRLPITHDENIVTRKGTTSVCILFHCCLLPTIPLPPAASCRTSHRRPGRARSKACAPSAKLRLGSCARSLPTW